MKTLMLLFAMMALSSFAADFDQSSTEGAICDGRAVTKAELMNVVKEGEIKSNSGTTKATKQ